jgi:hypothetical protein
MNHAFNLLNSMRDFDQIRRNPRQSDIVSQHDIRRPNVATQIGQFERSTLKTHLGFWHEARSRSAAATMTRIKTTVSATAQLQ